MSPFQSFVTLNTSAPTTIGCTAPLCAYPSCKCYVPLPAVIEGSCSEIPNNLVPEGNFRAENQGVGGDCMPIDIQPGYSRTPDTEEEAMKELDPGLGLGLDAYNRPAEVRAAPAPEYRKPRRVERQATKANRMIEFLAAGNREAALALVDEEDMQRRLPPDQIEKVISDEAFAELSASIGKSAADVIQPEAKLSEDLARAVDGMVAEGGPAGDTQ